MGLKVSSQFIVSDNLTPVNYFNVALSLLDTVKNCDKFFIVNNILLFCGLQDKGLIGNENKFALVVLCSQDSANSVVRGISLHLVYSIALMKLEDWSGK